MGLEIQVIHAGIAVPAVQVVKYTLTGWQTAAVLRALGSTTARWPRPLPWDPWLLHL